MKNFHRIVLTYLASLFFCIGFVKANNADALVGFWKTGEGNAVVQIYKQGDTYFGKIVWLKEPIDPATGKPKIDGKNEDHSLKGRPLLSMINLRDFKFIKTNHWEDGKIYDPKTGEDYSCKLTMIDKNTLEVRGYVGISLFGRTDTWKRQQVK